MDKPIFTIEGKRVWIAGSRGLVGAACHERFKKEPCAIIFDLPRSALDLRDANKTHQFIGDMHPDIIIMAAAKVGGIADNAAHPHDFLHENLDIQNSLIPAAACLGVSKLVFLGSSCIYPRDCPQPIREEYLGTGALEETNKAYARAKIAGIGMIKEMRLQGHDFISLMPCNLYGRHDHFIGGVRAHVIPALMHKFAQGGDIVDVWGTGEALREFMHADDLADAIVFSLKHYSSEMHLNVGTGEEISIAGLARMLADIAGFTGHIRFDSSKPDGTPRKILDSSKIRAMGWRPKISLQEGLSILWNDFSNPVPREHYRHG